MDSELFFSAWHEGMACLYYWVQIDEFRWYRFDDYWWSQWDVRRGVPDEHVPGDFEFFLDSPRYQRWEVHVADHSSSLIDPLHVMHECDYNGVPPHMHDCETPPLIEDCESDDSGLPYDNYDM